MEYLIRIISENPEYAVLFSALLAVISILMHSARFIFSRTDRGIDRKISVDEFWFLDILLHPCITPLNDFFSKRREAVSTLSIELIDKSPTDQIIAVQSYLKDFNKDCVVEQVPGFQSFNLIDLEVLPKIEMELEKLSDSINKSSSEVVDVDFIMIKSVTASQLKNLSTCHVEILRILYEKHSAIAKI
ncbi:MAG: hypothetical protein HQL71_01150 [Magnetococcales bacterium]|nr:hypothetical protein [Magnetococcales bacterium]